MFRLFGLVLAGCMVTNTNNLLVTKSEVTEKSDDIVCQNAKYNTANRARLLYKEEAKRRGLSCGVGGTPSTQIATLTTNQSNTPSSAELTAAQKEAERLRQELAALKAQQEQQQQSVSNDTQIPLITIASANTKGKQGVILGRASDNVGVAEVTASGQRVPFDAAGNFQYQTFVPTGGKDIVIEVIDVAGLTSKQTVSLTRKAGAATAAITFDSLNPLGRRVAANKDALALIIGVDGYENTPARAIYADSDAQMFADYATEKLGIPANRIKTLVNDSADEKGMLLAIKDWLARANRQGKSDIYIFFAGHGLASDDGEKMYLLPYDGSPRLLSDTAIARERLFADISAANPRSVTVFLDTCYSGTTRGTDMLIASRPIAIRALEQSIPDNFTVMTAAAGDQTAKPLEEAKHGMFSYFLMKGMEGEADANNDNEITAGELHEYVQTNVIQQSSGSQTPELQGDTTRVLVRFQ
ncbi:caspase family protein [Alphaproteobacteria bacterium]|nr:caspase family protein [Alphaproteobacteria bacterium]